MTEKQSFSRTRKESFEVLSPLKKKGKKGRKQEGLPAGARNPKGGKETKSGGDFFSPAHKKEKKDEGSIQGLHKKRRGGCRQLLVEREERFRRQGGRRESRGHNSM